MGDILADKIIASIDARRKIELFRLIRSLGIRNVGDHVAKILSRNLMSYDKICMASVDEMKSIHEIGPGVADSVRKYFDDQVNTVMIDQMVRNGVEILPDESGKDTAGKFSGMTFVFTGSLSRFTREEGESIVEDLGGRASSSVSKKTSYVVAGENAGSKLDKAQSLGITVLSEDEFADMVEM